MIVLELLGGPQDGSRIAGADDAPDTLEFAVEPTVAIGTYDDPLPVTFSRDVYVREEYFEGVWRYRYDGRVE